MNESTILEQLEGIVQQIEAPIGSSISNVLSDIETGFENDVITPLATDVSGALNSISQAVDYIGNTAGEALTSSLNAVSNTIGNVEQTVTNGFETGLNVVGNSISSIASTIESTFTSVVNNITSGFDGIEQQVGQGFTVIVNGLESGFQTLGEYIIQGITNIEAPVQAFIEALPQDIETIAGDVKNAIEDIVTTLGGATSQALTIATKDFQEAESAVVAMTNPATWQGPKQLFGDTIFDIVSGITGLDFSKADPLALARLGAAFDILFSVGVSLDLFQGFEYILGTNLPQLLEPALAGSWRDLEQMANGAVPNVLLRHAELVEGLYRGLIDLAFYQDQMERHGISDANSAVIYSIGSYLLQMTDLIPLYRRGLLVDDNDFFSRAALARVDQPTATFLNSLYDQLFPVAESITFYRRGILPTGWTTPFDDLVKSGWTSERIEALTTASTQLLSPQQLAEVIYRNIDDPTTSATYGYQEGITDEFTNLAKAYGYAETDIPRLYALSRPVPPFFIIEGLFKSGKLSETDFKALLALAGYSTYWQDQFVSNLQPSLTMADIKDMYKYQLISNADVITQLGTIGVGASLAQQYLTLWQATVKLSPVVEQTASAANAATVAGETKALIIEAFKDGVLTLAEATSALSEIGITGDDATLTLEIADYQIAQTAIKEAYDDAKADLEIGNITITAAIDQVQAAGATATQLDQLSAQLTKAGNAKGHIPTKAEFNDFYGEGLITAEQLYEGYSLLGYNDTWCYYYLQYEGVSASDIASILPNVVTTF